MDIHGLNKLTLLDYPGHMACLIFTGGCNYLCPFCQNRDLVLHPTSQPTIPEDEFLAFLKLRSGILEGVCISGGEPTLWPDLPDLIRKIKALGYKVKLDTNGSRPKVIKALLDEGLPDYIAMDIKNTPDKYPETTGLHADACPVDAVKETVSLIMNSGLPYEFRTTVVKELHTADDLKKIGEWLKGARAYYLQPFRDCDTLVGCPEGTFHSYTSDELKGFIAFLSPCFETVGLRGVD